MSTMGPRCHFRPIFHFCDTPQGGHVRDSGMPLWQACPMATDPRSRAREVNVSFRMTTDERVKLQEQASSEGYESVQQLLEARIFGAPKPRRKPGPQHQDERLNISA